VFNNGNTKPNEIPSTPCFWAQSDVLSLQRLFPQDYRTSLYLGLYLLQFAHYSLESDYEPIRLALEHASELNPTSAIPAYFLAYPYAMGHLGGMISEASASCLDYIVPPTKPCLALDDLHRTGLRYLTRSIAADPTFEPAYELRALVLLKLKESRQAIRDFSQALQLNPKANVYNDRALAEMDLKQYREAILDYSKAIARGCESTICPSYENRANAYMKLHDYQDAISDFNHVIRNFLAGTIFGFNIEQFRRIYPEYDDVADSALCEKLRSLFMPQMSYKDFSKQFLVDAKQVDDFVLPGYFAQRGDAYASLGQTAKADREYDRISAGYPKWAEFAFTTVNGKRIRNSEWP
jgi:tetratricopeptide (TPR) repeat protein